MRGYSSTCQISRSRRYFPRIIAIYHLHRVMFLALSHYVHFADAGVQSDSLPSASPTTMAPPTTANIGIIPTSLSTDPSAKPSTKVFPASEALLMFFFKAWGLPLGTFQRKVLPRGLLTTIIVTLGGPPPKILALASSLLQLWPTFSAVISGQTPPTIATPLLMVAHSASTSSLVPAPAQALLDDHPLEQFFSAQCDELLMLIASMCIYVLRRSSLHRAQASNVT